MIPSARDRAIITTLFALPLLRLDDLSVVLDCSTIAVRRHVAALREQGLVATISPALVGISSAQLAYLTPRGCALACGARTPEEAKATSREAGTYLTSLLHLLPRTPALIAHQNVLNILLDLCDAHFGAGRYRWRWWRGYTQRLPPGPTAGAFGYQLDALLCIDTEIEQTLYVRYRHWATFAVGVLMDNGIGDTASAAARLTRLMRFRGRAGLHPDDLPAVLIVVPSRARAHTWSQAWRDATRATMQDDLHGILLQLGHVCVLPWPLTAGALPTAAVSQPIDACFSAWDVDTGRSLPQVGNALFGTACASSSETWLTSPPGAAGGVPVGDEAARTAHDRAASVQPTGRTPEGRSRCFELVLATTIAEEVTRREQRRCGHTVSVRLARLALTLSYAQLTLLALIGLHPLIAADDLACLTGMRRRSAHERLRELRGMALIEERAVTTIPGLPPLEGSGELQQRLYCLRATELGMRLLAAVYGWQPNTRPFVLHTRERVTGHDPGVHRFFTLLWRAITSRDTCAGQTHSLDWRTAPEGRLIWQEWGTTGPWRTLYPDAVADVELGGRGGRFYLELDMATMNLRDLSAKLQAYDDYARATARTGVERLPLLLFVVPSERQYERLTFAAADAGAQFPRSLYSTSRTMVKGYSPLYVAKVPDLVRIGPLGRIWRPVSPTTTPGTRRQAVTLVEML